MSSFEAFEKFFRLIAVRCRHHRLPIRIVQPGLVFVVHVHLITGQQGLLVHFFEHLGALVEELKVGDNDRHGQSDSQHASYGAKAANKLAQQGFRQLITVANCCHSLKLEK